MSISNLFVPNDYDLFGRSINVRDLIADRILSKSTISYWDSTLSYDLGNFVIYNLSVWRSLANSNLNHTPSEASIYWVRAINLYQNNVDEKQVLVNQILGSDDVLKSNVIPFLTIQTALDYAGDDSYIYVSTTDGAYDIGTLTISSSNQNLATLANIGKFVNTLTGKLVISADARNFVLSGFKIDSTADTNPSVTINSLSNTYFQDCYFDDQNNISEIIFDDDPDLLEWGGNSTIFYNCQSNATETNTNRITIQGHPIANTKIYIYGWRGVVRLNVIPSNSNVQVYVVNCTQLSIAAHSNGLIYCDGNLVFPNDIVSTATNADPNNKLIILNSSMYNPLTSTYAHINKTGNCPWYFHDLDADIAGNTITGTGKYGNYFVDQLETAGNLIVDGTLQVQSLATFYSDVNIGGLLQMTGSFGIVSPSLDTNVVDTVDMNTINATCSGTLGVTGTSTLGVVNAGATSVTSLTSTGAVAGTNGSFSGTLGVTGASTLGVVHAGATDVTSLTSTGAVSGTTGTFTGAVSGTTITGSSTVTGSSLVSTGNVSADSASGVLSGYNLVLTNDVAYNLTMQISGASNPGTGSPPSNIYVASYTLGYRKLGQIAYFTLLNSGNFVCNSPGVPASSRTLYLSLADNTILFQTNTTGKMQPPNIQFTNNGPAVLVSGTTFYQATIGYVNTYNLSLTIMGGATFDVSGGNNSIFATQSFYLCAL